MYSLTSLGIGLVVCALAVADWRRPGVLLPGERDGRFNAAIFAVGVCSVATSAGLAFAGRAQIALFALATVCLFTALGIMFWVTLSVLRRTRN
ncbi:hypothetical protein ABZ234_08245 [Nocardiopsis sp. NPDC006198]|uniref:hypothetical protein n=1 Tax=Nocardiopsis sp. NPDC006198 TaxID=3154472 RepID=UPI0033B0C61B